MNRPTGKEAAARIAATLAERNRIRQEIELPVLAAIRQQAEIFDGKKFNRRFTGAVTGALTAKGVSVEFRKGYNGDTDYTAFYAFYRQDGKPGKLEIYPYREQTQDYTDEHGRLVAKKLIATCEWNEATTRAYIAADEIAISRAREFVARVEAVKAEIDAINKDFPMTLTADFHGSANLSFD